MSSNQSSYFIFLVCAVCILISCTSDGITPINTHETTLYYHKIEYSTPCFRYVISNDTLFIEEEELFDSLMSLQHLPNISHNLKNAETIKKIKILSADECDSLNTLNRYINDVVICGADCMSTETTGYLPEQLTIDGQIVYASCPPAWHNAKIVNAMSAKVKPHIMMTQYVTHLAGHNFDKQLKVLNLIDIYFATVKDNQ